jgi:hypothetical protein
MILQYLHPDLNFFECDSDDGNTSATVDDSVDGVYRGEDVKGTVNWKTGSVHCEYGKRGLYYKTFYASNCCHITIS